MRIAVFVDFWNFQLGLNREIEKKQSLKDVRAKIDWKAVGHEMTAAAGKVVDGASPVSFEGTYIFTSYNPVTDAKFRTWATGWLDRQPGINVEIRERKVRGAPKCPVCHQDIKVCPHASCGQPMIGTVEKGIDTLLITDMIRLAYSNTYDVAVLATSDADMVPGVKFIQTLNKKVIQAGFPPRGIDLATECWGSFNVMDIADRILRT
jgi:hypothetical protein